MCTLFGWLDYKGIVSNKLLKKLTQSLANAAEERNLLINCDLTHPAERKLLWDTQE